MCFLLERFVQLGWSFRWAWRPEHVHDDIGRGRKRLVQCDCWLANCDEPGRVVIGPMGRSRRYRAQSLGLNREIAPPNASRP